MPANYTYQDAIDLLVAEYNGANNKSTKLELIADLAALRIGNPNYSVLLGLIGRETDVDVDDALIQQTFIFVNVLAQEQIKLFEYCEPNYITNNPGYDGDTYKSYVGMYYSPLGEIT
jgi:hypothetical protein